MTLIAIAAVMLALGVAFGRASGPGEFGSSPSPARGATAEVSGRTRAGAVATATGFLGALRWPVLVDDERRRAVVARFAATGARSMLDERVSRGAAALRRVVESSPVVARPVFVGYRIAKFSPRRATVSVWGMALFATGAYPPVSQWSTSTFDLAWQDGAWKVAAMRSRPGPSPRWSVMELAREVPAFEEYRHVP